MTTSVVLLSALSTVLWIGLAQAQTESGFPLCNQDGSIPYGYNQCECPHPPVTYRGEFDDPGHEFQVHLPEGIVGIGGCAAGHSFRIYLARPDSSEPGGDFAWNSISVSGTENTPVEFSRIIEGWKQSWTRGIEEGDMSDLHLGQPEQISIASLPAIRLKASWTERDKGNLIGESIVANNPEKNVVYQIAIVSPANRWEKNRKLFETLVENFRYVPREDVPKANDSRNPH